MLAAFCQANLHHVSAQEVHIVGFADFNIPKTRAKETCQELCAALAFINAMGASKNACLLEMPDIPRESAKRGLADEERSIQDNLWNQLQHCDCRYIINFDVPSGGEKSVNRTVRRVGQPFSFSCGL